MGTPNSKERIPLTGFIGFVECNMLSPMVNNTADGLIKAPYAYDVEREYY